MKDEYKRLLLEIISQSTEVSREFAELLNRKSLQKAFSSKILKQYFPIQERIPAQSHFGANLEKDFLEVFKC